MPLGGGDWTASSSRQALLDVVLRDVIRGVESAGKLGRGPGQIPRETVAALVAGLTAAELNDGKRAVTELKNSLSIAPQVLEPHVELSAEMRDPFIGDLLARVARATAEGKLEEGARAIDRALDALQRGDATPALGLLKRLPGFSFLANRERKSQLLLAFIRQGNLLRDADMVADAMLARAALYDPGRPAWSNGFGAQLEAMVKQGQSVGSNFLSLIGAALARHRLSAAQTPEERATALLRLSTPLLTLADNEPTEARLNEARQTLQQTHAASGAAGLKQIEALAAICLEELANRHPVRPAQKAAKAEAPAPRKTEPDPGNRAKAQPVSTGSKHVDAPLLITPQQQAEPGPPAMSEAEARRPSPSPAQNEGRADARIRQALADLQAQDRIGSGPEQVPEACALALLHALEPEELDDPDRASHEVAFAISSAISVLECRNFDSPDLVLCAVLQNVARLTADGQLQTGADLIDEMLADAEASRGRFSEEGYRNRRKALLDASARQANLLRDADRAADAVVRLLALTGIEQPTASDAFAEQAESLHDQSITETCDFPAKVAVAMGWLRFELAERNTQRGEALLQLGRFQGELGWFRRDKAQLAEAINVIKGACEAFAVEAIAGDCACRYLLAQANYQLGETLCHLGEQENSQAHWEEATHAFRDAIEGQQRFDEPLWRRIAEAQCRLAETLQKLSQFESGTAKLIEAVEAHQAAGKAYTKHGWPDVAALIPPQIAAIEAEISRRDATASPATGLATPAQRFQESKPHEASVEARSDTEEQGWIGDITICPRQGPSPFVYRTSEIEALMAWAMDPNEPAVCVLAAPAGRGKTELLHQFRSSVESYRSSPDYSPAVSYVHLQRGEGHHELRRWLRRIEDELTHDAGDEPSDSESPRSAADIARACQTLLQRIDEAGQPLLIIVDGLDQSTDAHDALRWFQPAESGLIKLLVSVTERHGVPYHPSPTQWLRLWGWHGPSLHKTLRPLDENAARQVLLGYRVPETSLTPSVMQGLMQYSEGEPWLLDLYASEWQRTDRRPALAPESQGAEAGSPGSAARMLAVQGEHWPPSDHSLLHRTLRLLACGHGPMSARALKAAALHWDECCVGLSEAQLREHLAPFLEPRSDDLLSFDHPAVADHLRHAPEEADNMRRARQSILDWGLEEVRRLRSGQLAPDALDSYLTDWLHQHLAEADSLVDTWAQLFSPQWRDAHIAHRGHLGGFIRDLDAAARTVRRLQPPVWRSQLLRINLLRATAADMGSLPPGLAAAAARLSQLTLPQAKEAMAWVDPQKVWQGWLGLAVMHGEQGYNVFLDRAVKAVEGAGLTSNSALSWARVAAAHRQGREQEKLVEKLLHDRESLRDKSVYFDVVAILARHVGPDTRRRLLEGLVARMGEYQGWDALLHLLQHAPAAEWQPLIKLARPDAEPLDHLYGAGELNDFVAVTYRCLPSEAQAQFRPMVQQAVLHSSHQRCQAIGLIHLAATSQGRERAELVDKALALVDHGRPDLLAYLASLLKSEERVHVLAHAVLPSEMAGITPNYDTLRYFVELLEPQEVQRILDAVLALPVRAARHTALNTMAPLLDREQLSLAYASALRMDERDFSMLINRLSVAFDLPELSQGSEGLDAQTMLTTELQNAEDPAALLRALGNSVLPENQSEIVTRALRWWLEHSHLANDKAAADDLDRLWPVHMGYDAIRRISGAARAQRWPLERLRAELEATPKQELGNGDITINFKRSAPPPLTAEREQLRQSVAAVRAWTDCACGRGSADSPLHLSDILDQWHSYPKPLQRDAFEGFAHGLAGTQQVDLMHRPLGEWCLDNYARLARWAHAVDGIAGATVFLQAVRESQEAFA